MNFFEIVVVSPILLVTNIVYNFKVLFSLFQVEIKGKMKWFEIMNEWLMSCSYSNSSRIGWSL